MWTEITRRQYDRSNLRYASDLTDDEWNVIVVFLPPTKMLGRPRSTDLREVLNAILYMARTGCQWRMLPREFPPHSTVQRYFYAWRCDGTLRALNHHLLMAAREAVGREASPSAGMIDSQDRDGTPALPASIRSAFPWLRHVFADGGCAGPKLKEALTELGAWALEIVKRSNAAKGFVLLTRRWVVERTFAWLGRNRRLAKDFEKTIESAEAWLLIASTQILCRRFCCPFMTVTSKPFMILWKIPAWMNFCGTTLLTFGGIWRPMVASIGKRPIAI